MSGALNGHVAPTLLAPRYKALEVRHPLLTPEEFERLRREFREDWAQTGEAEELSPVEEYLCWLAWLRCRNAEKRYQLFVAAIERSRRDV